MAGKHTDKSLRALLVDGKTEPPSPGIYFGVEEAEYFGWAALNHSVLKHGMQSIAHLWYEWCHGTDRQTPEMALGTALHTMVLQPDRLAERVAVMPEGLGPVKGHHCASKKSGYCGVVGTERDRWVALRLMGPHRVTKVAQAVAVWDRWMRRGNLQQGEVILENCDVSVHETEQAAIAAIEEAVGAKAKECNLYDARALWMEEHGGKALITAEQWERAQGMAEALAAHPYASALLQSEGEREASIVWRDKETGLPMKCRIDKLSPRQLFADIKSTRDASPDGFPASIAKYGYHRQVVHYQDGILQATGQPSDGFIVAVESAPPHGAMVYEVDESSRDVGRAQLRRIVRELAACLASGKMTGYVNPDSHRGMAKPDDPITTGCPGWYLSRWMDAHGNVVPG